MNQTQEKISPTHTFLQRLEIALKYAGMKRGQLAASLKVAPSTLTRWNHGAEPRVGMLADISHLTGVRREWLSLGIGPMVEEKEETLVKETEGAYKVRKPDEDAEQLRNLDAAKLFLAVPEAKTGVLLGAAWTGLGDILNYRIPFDSQSLDKIKLMVDELVRRAPAATGYTPPIDPKTRLTQP